VGLRSYQQEALEVSKEKYDRGLTRQLISLPTGTGKTVVFAGVPRYFGYEGRTLVLVHREELADQAAEKIRHWNPHLSVGIEMAGRSCSDTDSVVIASVPTLANGDGRRLLRLKPDQFDVIICDEAHHSVAPSYKKIFEHFNLLSPDNKKLLLGFTATPKRGDNQALGQVYDQIVYEMPLEQAIEDGWLSEINPYIVETNTDISGVKITAGDYQIGALSQAVNNPARNELIVLTYLKHAKDRQTVVFTVDIQHAKDLADEFKRYGVVCEAIWGDDPDRAMKLKLHKEGKIQVLTNCGVLTEGYDDWQISCIILGRPTKSQLLYLQMIGRGTRLQHGIDNLLEARKQGVKLTKENCLLIDMTDNTGRHSAVLLGTIFGLPPKLNAKGKSITRVKKQIDEAIAAHPAIIDKLRDLKSIDDLPDLIRAVDIFVVRFPQEVLENSTMTWVPQLDGSYKILIPNKNYASITKDLLAHYEVDIMVDGTKIQQQFKTLPEAFRFAEKMLSQFANQYLTLLRRDAKWVGDPMSEAQLNLLRKFYGQKVPTNLTKGEARNLINQYISRKKKHL
jgi:ATP-dependent helicase IRC3